jgi:CBS domain-containing protein
MHSLVQAVMTTQVVTVGPATPFKELVGRLAEHRLSAVPVVDDDGRVLGVISAAGFLLNEEFPGILTRAPVSRLARARLNSTLSSLARA